jgi:site-specific recombinase XerD
MQLYQAIQEFLLASGADGLKEKTLIWYKSLLTTFYHRIGERTLESITANDVRLHIVHLREKYSDHSVHGHVRALHRFWRWCANEYEIANPMRNIRYPKQPKPQLPKAASIDDVIKLLASCDDSRLGIRDKAMIAFLVDTGCRAAGVCGLTMAALQMEQGRAIVIEKGDKQRVVMFTETTAHLLRKWLAIRNAEAATVFYGKGSEPLHPNGLYQRMMTLKARAGITGRVNPHSFRHGFAIAYITSGGDLITLSKILGHESVDVTAAFYGIFTPNQLGDFHDRFTPMLEINRKSKWY